jgi:hypothetical protein
MCPTFAGIMAGAKEGDAHNDLRLVPFQIEEDAEGY